MRRHLTVARTVAGGVLLAGVLAAAPASAATQAASEGTSRLDLLCARLEPLIVRGENLQARLDGDATTPGSLAFLQERADRAREAGRTNAATLLEGRLQIRRQRAEVLPATLDRLREAQAGCQDAGR